MQPKKKRRTEDTEDPIIVNYQADGFITAQLDELVQSVHHSTGHSTELYQQFSLLQTELLQVKASKKRSLADAVALAKTKKSKWPMFDDFVIPNGTFKFLPPTQLVASGSLSSATCIRKDLEIDALLWVPEGFYERKDYMNGRYLIKRALYLLHLVPKVKALECVKSIKYRYNDGNCLKPILSVRMTTGGSINIIPIITATTFPRSCLSPNHNALRPNKVFDQGGEIEEGSTSFYNNSILSDIFNDDLAEFHKELKSMNNLRKVLIILKIWSKRKGLGELLTGRALLYILHFLQKSGRINGNSDIVTLLKFVFKFLSDFTSEVHSEIGSEVLHRFAVSDFNLISRLASEVVAMLNHGDSNTLVPTLTDTVATCSYDTFDVIFTVPIPEVVDKQRTLPYCGVPYLGFVDHVREVLARAYGDRATFVHVCASLTSEWSRFQDPLPPKTIQIGVNVNKDTWTRHVDKGPPGDSPEAREFKAFWGNKCTLRRFQDSSILYAVVWNGRTVKERRSIIPQITEYVLPLHTAINKEDIIEHQFSSSHVVGETYYEGDGEEQAQKIIRTFTELSSILRNCSKIPLPITSVQGISPTFRNTSLYPQKEYEVTRKSRQQAFPVPGKPCPPYNEIHEMVCHFEMSGKWPEDIRAILRLKAAFYLALKEELESMHILAKVSTDFLDIVRNGFAFRLRCYVPKEAKLRSTNISFWAPGTAEELRVQTEILPYTASLLWGFTMLHVAFPLTVRYMKRWVHSHNLSLYVPDIFTELVVAHVFEKSAKICPIQTAMAGFVRTLSFLGSFDWDLFPVLIDLNDELSTETKEQYGRFLNSRKSYPEACIVTPKNELSQLTGDAPSKPTLQIVKILAERTLAGINAGGIVTSPETIFKADESTTAQYHIIIHIKPSQTGMNLDPHEGAREHHARNSHFPVIGYHPVRCFVNELADAFGDKAWFFYNFYDPLTVGVVLKNPGNTPTKFSVHKAGGKVVGRDGKVTDNIDAMVSDIDIFGKGLVKSIEVFNG